jgi:tRNA (guanine-N7-)-methyltransferase
VPRQQLDELVHTGHAGADRPIPGRIGLDRSRSRTGCSGAGRRPAHIVSGVSDTITPPGGRKVLSFVHRGGRMTHGQLHAWRELWPTYGRSLPPEPDAEPDLALEPARPEDDTGAYRDTRPDQDAGLDRDPVDEHDPVSERDVVDEHDRVSERDVVLEHDIELTGDGVLDLDGWFGRRAPVILEIGSGMGESTAALAAAAPQTNHLAVEVYPPGLAQLLMRIRDGGLGNLRLIRGDGVRVLRDYVGPGSLAGIRVYFSDPWPKRKHHKRRLVQPGFVALAASRLQPGGTLHLATDWAHYAEQMYRVCEAEPMLRNGAPDGSGWTPRPPWRPLTKFEQRAVAEGRTVRDLVYVRR